MATDEEIDAAYERIPQATAVEIFIDDPDDIDSDARPLQAATDRPLVLTDWQQRNETFFSALQVERVVMFVILSMIILVAAFNIISSLVMLVKDKGADIAVLRTMGATRGSIMRIFSMTGTAIGVIGTLVGAGPRPAHRRQRRAASRLRVGRDRRRASSRPKSSSSRRCRRKIDPAEVTVVRLPRARPLVPRDALSGMARRPVRSGRGAAV